MKKIEKKLPTYYNSQLTRRYQWTILPQGLIDSLTLCQYFVSQPLEIIHNQFPKSITYHYMDDILLSDSNMDTLERIFEEVKKALPKWGLQTAPGKIQNGDSISCIGYKIDLQKIRTQKAQIKKDQLWTMNDFLRFLEDIFSL